ncbi:polycomb group RING finger protein 6 [Siphateles boraxobius]|uniref:polycomb group RING finger protein 6 n=1 Tax=Siphateles boraxobius TaxID=180520 RepID=UPI004062C61D
MDGTVDGVVVEEEGSTRGCFQTDASLCEEDESQRANELHPDDERSLPLRDFYPYIRCALCNGFFIDATTITECLHTFCKSCIVKHFFYSNRCPNCSIVVHQTQPLYSIRPDRQLQDIVFKMVPYLEGDERSRICEFYKLRGLDIPKQVAAPSTYPMKLHHRQKKDMLPQSIFTIPSELDVSLMLEFVGAEEGVENYKPLERKYVRVSGEATVRHVELFIRRKMELSQNCKVDVVCGDHLLKQYQSLRDVCNTMGQNAFQDGMLVLHFGLVLPA